MKYRILSLGLSLLIYGLAMVLPCLLFKLVPIAPLTVPNPNTYYTMRGFELTFFGLFGLMFLQITALGWLANPIYWVSCFFFAYRKYKISAILGIAAVAIGFSGTLLGFHYKLLSSEGLPPNALISTFLPGFWVWLAAPGLLALVSLFYLSKKPRYSERLSKV